MKDDEDILLVHELIAKKEGLSGSYYSNLSIVDITSEAPYQIPGIRIYGGSYQMEIDPVPGYQWVLVKPDKLVDGMIDGLREINFMPKSKEEALGVAKLVLFAHDSRTQIYPNFEGYSNLKEKYDELANPVVIQKKEYYEVILFSLLIINEITFLPEVSKNIIKIGKNIYEWKQEKLPDIRFK
ncbi:MAG: hypothetical protein ACETVT_01650 [bacterium]